MSNKQASNKEANIRAYYSEVNKFEQNGEYDKAIKSLNKSKFLAHLNLNFSEWIEKSISWARNSDIAWDFTIQIN